MYSFFFFNASATTDLYTLSLHDRSSDLAPLAAPRSRRPLVIKAGHEIPRAGQCSAKHGWPAIRDRKSTRLNSSHSQISYAVFCLKKKNFGTNHKRGPHLTGRTGVHGSEG